MSSDWHLSDIRARLKAGDPIGETYAHWLVTELQDAHTVIDAARRFTGCMRPGASVAEGSALFLNGEALREAVVAYDNRER